MNEQISSKEKPKNVQWDNIPFNDLIEEIGNNLINDNHKQFAEELQSKIHSSIQKIISDGEEEIPEDNEFLADIINSVIEADPDIFKQLKNEISLIFDENQQFNVPQ